ncbi:hypothetical protein CL655_02875 [bacterium]|nr:hypothetical protein [bacterium]|tara:strand:+ start:5015 stop:5491 length:477 start_codon:yes stop_codon:yes gene_type:complete
MSKLPLLIGVGVLVFLIGYVVYQGINTQDTGAQEERAATQSSESPSDITTYREQTDETGPVSVTVKPLALPETGDWEFAWTLQTHSVDLSMDILESVVIIDDDGKEIKPTAWDGDPPGGHHRTGTVRFTAPDAVSEKVTVQVRNVAGVPMREFNWQLY